MPGDLPVGSPTHSRQFHDAFIEAAAAIRREIGRWILDLLFPDISLALLMAMRYAYVPFATPLSCHKMTGHTILAGIKMPMGNSRRLRATASVHARKCFTRHRGAVDYRR